MSRFELGLSLKCHIKSLAKKEQTSIRVFKCIQSFKRFYLMSNHKYYSFRPKHIMNYYPDCPNRPICETSL